MPSEKKLQLGNTYKKDNILKCVSSTDLSKQKTPKKSNKTRDPSSFYIESDDGEKIPVQSYAAWSKQNASRRSNNEVRDGPPTTPTKVSSKTKSKKKEHKSSTIIVKKSTPKKKQNLFNMFKGKSKKTVDKQQIDESIALSPPRSIKGSSSFQTTTSTATEKRSNTINTKINNSINTIDGKAPKKKTFLNIIDETDCHSEFSSSLGRVLSGDEASTCSKRTQLSEQIDKQDNDLLCDLISQTSEHEEKKIFNKALSEADDDDDDDNNNNGDKSDLLFGDDEEIEVQHIQSKRKKEAEEKKQKEVKNEDAKFFTKIARMFSPKSDEKRMDKKNSVPKKLETQKSSDSAHRSSKHEIVNIDLDGIDIISLPPLSTATSTPSFMSKHRYDRIIQTMSPAILVESDFESKEHISPKYVAMLMEGYNEKIRWYVKIRNNVLENMNVKEQVSEVIMDVPSKSSKKIDDGISLTKMRHDIAKHMQRGELSIALNTLNESLLSLLKKRNIHSTLGANFHNIGNLKLMLGLYDEAKASYLAAIRARVKKLGDEHPDVVVSLSYPFHYSSTSKNIKRHLCTNLDYVSSS